MPSDKPYDHNPFTVLWLPSWYPGKRDASNGDFIERMARAASLRVRVLVLVVDKDPGMAPGASTIEREEISPNLIVYRVEYGPSGTNSMLERWRSFRQYRKLQQKGYEIILRNEGPVDRLHVHVAFKAGLLALQRKRKLGTGYLLTEHWTGYLPGSRPNFSQMGLAQQWITRKIIRQCDQLLPVSRQLGETIKQSIAPCRYTVIPNVVDTRFFFSRPVTPPRFRFFHASYLNEQKNPDGMIRAASRLANEGMDFELHLVGNRVARLEKLASDLGVLGRQVFIEGAIPYEEVATRMQESSALLMFSRWENLPCVILEALCCGLPVLATDTGGIAEVIDEKNGMLIPEGDEDRLVQAMRRMIECWPGYDREAIANKAKALYSYETIAAQLEAVYRDMPMPAGADH